MQPKEPEEVSPMESEVCRLTGRSWRPLHSGPTFEQVTIFKLKNIVLRLDSQLVLP
jgi:hypothetical protein